MGIVIFLGIPVLVCVVLMILTLPLVLETDADIQRLKELDSEEAPRFMRDYSGRVWVDKQHKGFFRTLRRRPGPHDQSSED